MTTLLIATRNPHKLAEIHAILGTAIECLTLRDFPGAPEVAEDAGTFAGNATKKAVALARWVRGDVRSGIRVPSFVLADDSGLEVDALGGQPGVHSARFAALDSGRPGNSPDADNNTKLLRLLAEVPSENRTARFHCVIALVPVPEAEDSIENASPVCFAGDFEPVAQLFDGVCEGRIQLQPKGQGGFGYDPLFVPDGFTESFAQLGEVVKNRLSHRARALARLKSFLGK